MLRQLISNSSRIQRIQTRSFHSPFAILSGVKTSVETAPTSSAASQSLLEKEYEATSKQKEIEPTEQPSARKYVVCDTNPNAQTWFGVKSGAYLVSEPFA